jgi:hypothetical protein
MQNLLDCCLSDSEVVWLSVKLPPYRYQKDTPLQLDACMLWRRMCRRCDDSHKEDNKVGDRHHPVLKLGITSQREALSYVSEGTCRPARVTNVDVLEGSGFMSGAKQNMNAALMIVAAMALAVLAGILLVAK